MKKRIRPWCRHFPHNDMPDTHRCDAKLALILEAPGKYEDEDEYGRPIVGPSGYDLQQWWQSVGLRRDDFYIDNTYPYRPPENKLEAIPLLERAEMASECVSRLRRQDPNLVVVAGNYALRAVLANPKLNISDWRGSILGWNNRKLIPTYHPAVTQRQKVLTKLCVADWKRIAEEKDVRELRLPERRLVIDPSEEEMKEFEDAAQRYFERPLVELSPPRVLSVDVENVRTGNRHLTCVGMSFDPNWAITVSTRPCDYADEAPYARTQYWLLQMLLKPYTLMGQNFQTDLFKLVQWDRALRAIQPRYVWDLIEMAHLLDPNDGGDTEEGSESELDGGSVRVGMMDLATLTSLYTRQPFYKHLASSPSWEVRMQYNGLDCCVQREIFDVLWQMLNERQFV